VGLSRREVESSLVGHGGQFEVVVESVRGLDLKVYKDRLPSLRSVYEIGAAHGDREHVVVGDVRMTFADVHRAVNSVSKGLAARGIGRGDRVAVLSANNPEWLFTFWGAVNLGAVVVGLNGWWKADEVVYGLTHSGAKVLVVDTPRYERVVDRLGEVTTLESIVVIGRDFDELLVGGDTVPTVAIDEDDPAVVFYTSGTTGHPKGAVSTHRSMIATLQNQVLTSTVNGLTGRSSLSSGGGQPTMLLTSPLFHVSGCHAALVVGMLAGVKLVMPEGRFDAADALRLIERERVTLWSTVPTMVWRAVEHPARHDHDLSSVVTVVYGGSPAGGELQRRAVETFPSIRSTGNAYGLTETASAATILVGEDALTRPDSVGRPFPIVDVRVVGEDGVTLPAGEIGEIEIRGPIVMAGYLDDEAATAAAIGPDGWFHSGDLGRLDEDGFLHVTGRAKDLIIRGGENIYPAEIEERLVEHPAVAEAGVVGVPDPVLGEQVKAIVRLLDGASVTTDELRTWVAATLADFKVPVEVEVRADPLPRNAAGKLMKDVLRGIADLSLTETL
jgi:long-chain acyl-CoA synthetase